MARKNVVDENRFEFTGKLEYQPKAGDKDPETGETLYPYLTDVSEGLVEAVQLAIALKRPLLLEGEPGCGKTRLAKAVAYEFSQRYNNVKWVYQDWCIKSTDQARDGLYMYDAVMRLYDAQLAATDEKAKTRFNDDGHKDYINMGALGKAFAASAENQRTIVLIDEIDKADIDFPNDLLLELEEKRFTIRETRKEVRAKEGFEPIIFIASNAQRKLPDAFLRRCLYHYMEFPDQKNLCRIVEARIGKIWSKKLINQALQRFLEVRQRMEDERGDSGKKISVSELLDWFTALHLHTDKSQLEQLLGQQKIPYASTLLKSREDLQLIAGDSGDEDEDDD